MGSITEHCQRNVIAHHGRALADQVRENGKCSLVSGFLSTLSEIRAPKSMTQSRSSQSCGASLSFQSLLYVGIFIPNTVMLDQKHHYILCSHAGLTLATVNLYHDLKTCIHLHLHMFICFPIDYTAFISFYSLSIVY